MTTNKILNSKCRNLVSEYSDVFEYIVAEIYREVDSERISGDDAFTYAKKAIRREAFREALTMFRQRINRYADTR